MTDLTAQIEKALDGATPGPWTLETHHDHWCEALTVWSILDADGTDFIGNEPYYPYQSDNLQDARLIALAPQMAEAHLAMAKRLEAAEAVVRRFATALSMIETEISSAETYNPAISAIVRGELDWADEQYVSAAFRGEGG